MKKSTLILVLLPVMANGQNDSLQVKELNEMVVVAQMQRAETEKTVYLPDVKQKEASSDGYALLSRMQIPQLSVNLLSETVKTATNEGVALFINGLPASKEDINGLNPRDVRRVEYYDFPAEARFQRAPHVVNFVTVKYDYGGYTKLTAKERFIVNSGNGQLYSKMAYKEMDYDLIVTADYESGSHIGSDTREVYRLATCDVSRSEIMQSGKYREKDLYSAFRATWNHNKLTFRNKIGYTGQFIPANDNAGSVSLGNMSADYLRLSDSRSNAADWASNITFDMSGGWSLSGNLMATYTVNHLNQAYRDIINNAREQDVTTRQEFQVNKSFSQAVSVFLQSIIMTENSRVRYVGSTDALNKFSVFAAAPMAGTAINVGKIYGSADAGFAYENNSINGLKTDDYYPFVHLNAQYSPNNKNSFGLYVQYATMSPNIAMKSPNVLQENEILYIAGNPKLKNSRHTSVVLNYTWLPSNKWQLTAYAVMFKIANRQIPIYTPEGPEGMMLKRYENNGDYNHGQTGMNLTGKYIDGRLTVSAAPRLMLYRTTGAYCVSKYPVSGTFNANYYLSDFHFSVYWSSKNSYVDGEDCFYSKMPSEYALTAGWSHAGWNIELMGANLFRSSWLSSRSLLQSQYYDCSTRQYGSDFHRRVSLTVGYTFNYGKKISKNNELQQGSSASSNILK